jgi:hypothetical protein
VHLATNAQERRDHVKRILLQRGVSEEDVSRGMSHHWWEDCKSRGWTCIRFAGMCRTGCSVQGHEPPLVGGL